MKNTCFELKIKDYYILTARLKKSWGSFNGVSSPFLKMEYLYNIFIQRRNLNLWRGEVPFFRCIEDVQGNILMIAPLRKNIVTRKYRMLADGAGCGCADFIYNPSLNIEEQKVCTEFLLNSLSERIVLNRIPQTSHLLHFGKLNSNTECCYIPIGMGYTEWYNSLSSSVRQNLRTAYNRLARNNIQIDFMLYSNDESLIGSTFPIDGKLYSKCLDLYIKRQLSKYRKCGAIKKLIKVFSYRNIMHDSKSLLNLDNALMIVLKYNNVIAAYMGAYISNDKKSIVVPRLAINDEYSFYSPGYVMIAELIKKINTYGSPIEILDLTRGLEKYKLDLGGKCYSTYNLNF